MTKGSQFFSNCSNLTTEDFISINLAFSGTGAACCLISILIVLLLLISRAYHSVLQRLFFYLMVATALREFFLAASIEHHFEYSGQEKVCTWVAFIYNWTGIVVFVFTVGIMIYLFFLVRYVAKGNTVPQFLQPKCRRVSLEVAYVVLATLIMFIYASVPYFTNNYGLAGAWCWIRALDENCKVTLSGLLAQLFHGHIFYESGGITGIILMIAIAVVYYRLPVTQTLSEARLLLKKTFVVMICFFLYVIVVVIALSIRMITAKTTHYQDFAICNWFSIGITYPISLLLFPVAFLICFNPIGKITKSSICAKCPCCRNKQKTRNNRVVHFQQQPAYTTHVAPTFQESTRVSPPSNTFYNAPYTNGFTHVTTENAPLISEGHIDTGYGSTSQH